MSEQEKCGVRLGSRGRWDHHSRFCERPATEEVGEKRMCKLHANAARKRKQGYEDWKRGYEADKALSAELVDLSERHGFTIRAARKTKGGADHERVVIPRAELDRLLSAQQTKTPQPSPNPKGTHDSNR